MSSQELFEKFMEAASMDDFEDDLEPIAEKHIESLGDVHERDIDDRIDEYLPQLMKKTINDFPEDSLFEFVKKTMLAVQEKGEDANTTFEKDKSKILIQGTDGEITLMPHYITVSSTAAQEDVQERVVNKIQRQYKNFARLPDTVRKMLVRYLFTHAISTIRGKKGATRKETLEHLGTLGRKEQRTAAESQDRGLLDELLKKFYLRGTNQILTFKKLFDDDWNPKDIDISDVALRRNTTEGKIIDNLRLIHQQEPRIQHKLAPILDLLEIYRSTGGKIIEIEADSLIGSFDLKKLKRREQLYAYWGNKHKEYNEFRDAYIIFKEGLEDLTLGSEDEDTSQDKDLNDIRQIMSDLIEFEDKVKSGELNYIVAFKPLTLETYFTEDKGWLLFEKLANELELLKDFNAKELAEEISGDTRETVASEIGEQSDSDANLPLTSVDASKKTVGGDLEHELKQISEFGVSLDKLTHVNIDPIYYHAFTKEGGAFKNTVVFAREIAAIRGAMESAGAARELIDGVDMDDDILDYVNKLEKLAAIEYRKDGYYLPLQTTTRKFIYDLKEDYAEEEIIDEQRGQELHLDEVLKNVGTFLDLIAKILDSGSDLDRSASPSISETTDTSHGPNKMGPRVDEPEKGRSPFTSTYFLGREGKKSHLEEIAEVRDEFDDLLDEILSFFVMPLMGENKPFDDPIPFEFEYSNSPRFFKMLAGGKKPDTAFFRGMMMESRKGSLLVSKDMLEEIVVLLEWVTNPAEQKDLPTMIKKYKQLAKTVNWILKLKNKSSMGQEVFTELGAQLHEVLEENDMQWPEKTESGEDHLWPSGVKWSKTPEQWSAIYKKDPDHVWPLKFIANSIKEKRESYSQNPKTQSKGVGRKERGADTLVQRFFNSIDDMKLTRSIPELQILQAHDNIRKMLGKPVYFNTSKTDNFDHVTKAVEALDEKYKVNVSAFEIESIVNEIGSMSDIGKKHGIPADGVYFVKANFR